MDDSLARELMLRTGKGDLEAFGLLVEAHQAVVLRVVHRYLGRNAADAEDIAQEVFIRAFRARERYRAEARFTTWLLRICSNRCLNYLRDQKHRRTLSLDGPGRDEDAARPELADPAADAPGDIAATGELREAVREAIERLPDTQRLALLYARYEGMSHAEIAAAMDMTEKAVKSLLFRARESLRRILEPQLRRLGAEHLGDEQGEEPDR